MNVIAVRISNLELPIQLLLLCYVHCKIQHKLMANLPWKCTFDPNKMHFICSVNFYLAKKGIFLSSRSIFPLFRADLCTNNVKTNTGHKLNLGFPLYPILFTIVLAKILRLFAKFMPAWCSTFQKRALWFGGALSKKFMGPLQRAKDSYDQCLISNSIFWFLYSAK